MTRTENEQTTTPTEENEFNANNNKVDDPTKPPGSRSCHLVKRPDFDGYGFNLHSEKVKPGQYIGKVDSNSPAEAAGLREGDQIIEVNGVNIGSETHKQVVQRIKAIANEVRLLLVDPNISITTTTTIEKNAANAKRSGKSSSPPVAHPVPPPVVPDQKDYTPTITVDVPKSPTNDHDTTDSATKEHNGKANGQAAEPAPKEHIEQPEPTTQPPDDDHSNTSDSASTATLTATPPGLNLNLTAAEMRAKLLSRKKFDPKNDSVDLKKKFEIIQKL